MIASLACLCCLQVALVLGLARAEDTWAVLVGTSRYWHNYRHMTNVMAMYEVLKSTGMLDDRIVVMSASDAACDVRNTHPADVVAGVSGRKRGGKGQDQQQPTQLYHTGVQIDYQGLDVSIESFTQVMTGRHAADTPALKRLDSHEDSNVLLYMTGHGGDGFFKFHDVEEMSAEDMARVVNDMAAGGRYREMLVVVDTCQAETLFELITAPRVTVISSSRRGENSYAFSVNSTIAAAPSDRFTLRILEYLEQQRPVPGSRHTVRDLMSAMDPNFLFSSVTAWTSPLARTPEKIRLSEFFAPQTGSKGAPVARDFDNRHLFSSSTPS